MFVASNIHNVTISFETRNWHGCNGKDEGRKVRVTLQWLRFSLSD